MIKRSTCHCLLRTAMRIVCTIALAGCGSGSHATNEDATHTLPPDGQIPAPSENNVATTEPGVRSVKLIIPGCEGPGGIKIPNIPVTLYYKTDCETGTGKITSVIPSNLKLTLPQSISVQGSDTMVESEKMHYSEKYSDFRVEVQTTLSVSYAGDGCKPEEGIAGFKIEGRLILDAADVTSVTTLKPATPPGGATGANPTFVIDKIDTMPVSGEHWYGPAAESDLPTTCTKCIRRPAGLTDDTWSPVDNNSQTLSVSVAPTTQSGK